jgi:hypothetical protein
VLLTSVAVGVSSAGATGTGLRGLVTRGPTRPVCEIGTPCSEPAPGVRLTFVRGAVIRSTTTDETGHYRIALAPGTYAVRIASAKFGYSPTRVLVPVDRVKVRNFDIDTGIR